MATSLSQHEFLYEIHHWNDTRKPSLIAGSVVLITGSTLTVALRLWSRRFKHIKLEADDYSILVALV